MDELALLLDFNHFGRQANLTWIAVMADTKAIMRSKGWARTGIEKTYAWPTALDMGLLMSDFLRHRQRRQCADARPCLLGAAPRRRPMEDPRDDGSGSADARTRRYSPALRRHTGRNCGPDAFAQRSGGVEAAEHLYAFG